MKKIFIVLLSALLIGLVLCGCGKVKDVQITIGESELYSQREIESAMRKVKWFFRLTFDGCTLRELSYDEEKSARETAEWAESYGAEQAIVILSEFDVDESGGDGSLNPNSTYKNWQWILTRSRGGGWTLQDWGYG